jgi:uncharacterized BrkB/YihY/UPF0761 family membrane protein
MRIQSRIQLLGGLLLAIWSSICTAEQAVDMLKRLYGEHQPWRQQDVMKGAASIQSSMGKTTTIKEFQRRLFKMSANGILALTK